MDGFDNIAAALTTSPAFLDQYITAARRIAKAGVGDMHPPISSWSYKTGGNQDPELPFPPGIRGAMAFTHDFPADGEYRFSTAFDEQSIGFIQPWASEPNNASADDRRQSGFQGRHRRP